MSNDCNESGMAGLGAAHGSAPRHEMVSNDGPTWCNLCGTFDVYCFMANGEMTECHPKPESKRWWNPKSPNDQALPQGGAKKGNNEH